MKLSPAMALATLLPTPRIKQRELDLPPLEEPYLGPTGAIFFAWLMKTGEHKFKNKLSICKVEWERAKRNCGALPLKDKRYDFEKFIKCIDTDIIYMTTDHGEEVVKLTKKGRDWAERWTIEYRTYRGHHEDVIILAN